MTHNIFNHDNGIINEYPDRENEGKQGDTVQGKSVEVKDE